MKKDKTENDSEESKDENTSQDSTIHNLEVLGNLPPDLAKKFLEVQLSMSSYKGPMPNPILTKINEQHIDKILEIDKTEIENKFKSKESAKKYKLFYVLIFVALFVFITFFIADKNPELYKEILRTFLAFAAGVGSGYGIKFMQDKKSKE